MVGNDFVQNINKKKIIREPVKEVSNFNLPEPASSDYDLEFDLSSLAYNSSFSSQPAISLGSVNNHIFVRSKTKFIVLAFIVMLSIGVVLNWQFIVSQTNSLKAYAVAVSKEMSTKKQSVPSVSSRQIIISSSDYYNAITALITQNVTINLGSSAQSVSGSTITNWLNSQNHGSLTYISVNTGQIANSINQLITSSGQTIPTVNSNSAVVSQVANSLLKAKGVSVNIPLKTN